MDKTIVPKSENTSASTGGAKVSAKPTGPSKRCAAHSSPATVIVKYDAGWGNSLTLRGEGPGLSWDAGTPLCCVNHAEWVWVAPTTGMIAFKVLLNDRAWSHGENIVAAPGKTVTVTPTF